MIQFSLLRPIAESSIPNRALGRELFNSTHTCKVQSTKVSNTDRIEPLREQSRMLTNTVEYHLIRFVNWPCHCPARSTDIVTFARGYEGWALHSINILMSVSNAHECRQRRWNRELQMRIDSRRFFKPRSHYSSRDCFHLQKGGLNLLTKREHLSRSTSAGKITYSDVWGHQGVRNRASLKGRCRPSFRFQPTWEPIFEWNFLHQHVNWPRIRVRYG